MSKVKTFEQLVEQGTTLAPKGGSTMMGYNGQLQPDYVAWRMQAMSALEELGAAGRPLLKEMEKDKQGSYFYSSSAAIVLGILKAGLAAAKKQEEDSPPTQSTPKSKQHPIKTSQDKAFIVHGHDEVLLQQVARFLEHLEIEPTILFEKAGKGKTIIEKLESNSDVGFAVVLLTPDDMGKDAKEEGQPRPRARQNVILELGYFIGKLGRPNTVVLYDESVELPSDYRGVEYIKVDADGAWKLKLAREMKEAGLNVDMNNAI